mgnify:CR=1 FL=1
MHSQPFFNQREEIKNPEGTFGFGREEPEENVASINRGFSFNQTSNFKSMAPNKAKASKP